MTVLVDANVLLYARFDDFTQHEASRGWLDTRLGSMDPVAIPWPSLSAFVRIATNRRVFATPLQPAEAVDQVLSWCARPNVWCPEPGERFADLFRTLVVGSGASGSLVPDAWLAALAMEHALTVVSWDQDFARFPGVQWTLPVPGEPAGDDAALRVPPGDALLIPVSVSMDSRPGRADDSCEP